MWNELKRLYGQHDITIGKSPSCFTALHRSPALNWRIDVEQSFYVGDAAGRPADHSDADVGFATNAGLTFYTPEVRLTWLAPAGSRCRPWLLTDYCAT